MQVYIKDIPHEPVRLKNKGIEIEIKDEDGEELLGRLSINKGKLTWRPGQATVHGYSMSWTKFISVMEEQGGGKGLRSPFSIGPSIF